MPIMSVVILPLLALYIKFKIAQFTLKVALFGLLYLFFKQGMEWSIAQIMGKLNGLNFPCMTTYILNSLDIFSMINFALSFYASVYISRFVYNNIIKLMP